MEEKQENTEQRPAQRPGKPRATTSTTRTSTPTAKTATARTRTGSGHRGPVPPGGREVGQERPGVARPQAPPWQGCFGGAGVATAAEALLKSRRSSLPGWPR